MRYAPAAAALSLLFAVSASVGSGAERKADPRAAMLVAEGRAALSTGDAQAAVDADGPVGDHHGQGSTDTLTHFRSESSYGKFVGVIDGQINIWNEV